METSILSETPAIILQHCQYQCSVSAIVIQAAGHESIFPDENYAHMFPWAQADHQNRGENLEETDCQTF